MPRTTIETAYSNLAEAMAALVEHPQCPNTIRNSLLDYWEEFHNRHSPALDDSDFATIIRKELPALYGQFVAKELDEADEAENWPECVTDYKSALSDVA